MKLSGETLLLAPDVESPEDAFVKRGIYNGLRAIGWEGDVLNEDEDALLKRLRPREGSGVRDGLSLTRKQAGAALAGLLRNQTVVQRYDCVGDEDKLAWDAIPRIQDFLARDIRVANG